MVKKIIGIVAFAIVVTAIGLLVGLNWQGLKAIFSGSQIYTAEQFEESYNQGYDKANTNEKLYLEQLEYYKQIENAYAELVETNLQLQIEYEKLENDNKTNNETIVSLKKKIVGLENEITRLTALLDSYSFIVNNTFEVTFKDGENIISTQQIRIGNYVTDIPSPEKDGYNFLGWSIDGQNIVDLTIYSIEEKTTFVALFELVKYEVTFKNGDSVVSTLQVDNGSCVTSTPTIKDDTFMGWTLDGQNIVEDISSQAVTSNVTYIARFGTWTQLHYSPFDERDGCTCGYYYDKYNNDTFDFALNGLKANDKIKVVIDRISIENNGSVVASKFGITDYYLDGKTLLGFNLGNGNSQWEVVEEIDMILTNEVQDFVCGRNSLPDWYYNDNFLHLSVSCNNDNVLTVNYSSDNARYVPYTFHIKEVLVLR